MGKRNYQVNTTLGNAIGDLSDALASFAEDIRNSADNMGETFPGSDRTTRYEEAADALESISLDTETPEDLLDVKVSFQEDTRANPTNRTRLGNLVNAAEAIFAAAQDATAGRDDEDLDAYVAMLESVFDELQGVEL